MPDKLAVIFQRISQAANDRVDACCLTAVELVILEVDVMDDFGKRAKPRVIVEPELLDKGFKGAVFTYVCKLRPVHIKANAVPGLGIFGDKGKARTLINKPFDEPDGRQTINVQVPAGDPSLS